VSAAAGGRPEAGGRVPFGEVRWDPVQYGRFADERNRPFLDLTTRIGATAPRTVVDLGCGAGELTLTLARRWPGADVRGIDSSPEMIGRAPAGSAVTFTVGDAAAFHADGVDVVVSNAMLQWLPGHRELLARWAQELAPGGWLAFQVPANFDAPVHVIMRELAASAAWRDRLGGLLRDHLATSVPEQYLQLLARAGMTVDAWQTEYLHVLQGTDPVLEWVRGTGLRPVLQALDSDAAERFCRQYGALLREAYPAHPWGTVLPFLRTFVVAQRPR
jgi:trans-aconitate 2-methyltransferase